MRPVENSPEKSADWWHAGAGCSMSVFFWQSLIVQNQIDGHNLYSFCRHVLDEMHSGDCPIVRTMSDFRWLLGLFVVVKSMVSAACWPHSDAGVKPSGVFGIRRCFSKLKLLEFRGPTWWCLPCFWGVFGIWIWWVFWLILGARWSNESGTSFRGTGGRAKDGKSQHGRLARPSYQMSCCFAVHPVM